MTSIDFPVSRAIFLTGAGFTHNFGGFLARSMWAEIHNRIQQSGEPRLIQLIKSRFNYEELYHTVVNGKDYTLHEKSAFIDAVLKAYEALDGLVRDYNNRYLNTTFIDLDRVNDLIARFAGQSNEKGFFFTLNQDLFVERYYSSQQKLVYPGVSVNYIRFNNGRDKELVQEDLARIPTQQEELQRHKSELKSLGGFYYVKLHGSYDWRDSNNQKKLVIGVTKDEQIKTEPILSWYFELLEEVLSLPERRLLIIGYGFRDQHINEVLAKSVIDSGLKIFIVNPTDPERFQKTTLENTGSHKRTLWDGIVGYYPLSLGEFFPYGTSSTQHYRTLLENLFDH